MFSTANRTSVSPAIRSIPSAKPRGVLALPPERRVHHDRVGAEQLGRGPGPLSLTHGSGLHTRWVITRQGACTASTGTPW